MSGMSKTIKSAEWNGEKVSLDFEGSSDTIRPEGWHCWYQINTVRKTEPDTAYPLWRGKEYRGDTAPAWAKSYALKKFKEFEGQTPFDMGTFTDDDVYKFTRSNPEAVHYSLRMIIDLMEKERKQVKV